jgi:hypothetical protein
MPRGARLLSGYIQCSERKQKTHQEERVRQHVLSVAYHIYTTVRALLIRLPMDVRRWVLVEAGNKFYQKTYVDIYINFSNPHEKNSFKMRCSWVHVSGSFLFFFFPLVRKQHTKQHTHHQKPRKISLSLESQIKIKFSHFTYGGVCTFFQTTAKAWTHSAPGTRQNQSSKCFQPQVTSPEYYIYF